MAREGLAIVSPYCREKLFKTTCGSSPQSGCSSSVSGNDSIAIFGVHNSLKVVSERVFTYISFPCIQTTGSMWSLSVVVPVVVLSMFEAHVLLSYLSRQHVVWMYFSLLLILTVVQTLVFNLIVAFLSPNASAVTIVTLPTGVGDILRDTKLEYNLPRSPKSSTSSTSSSAAVCAAIAV
jgi:hypothetical protein